MSDKRKEARALSTDDLFSITGGAELGNNTVKNLKTAMVQCPYCNKRVKIKSYINGGYICENNHQVYDA